MPDNWEEHFRNVAANMDHVLINIFRKFKRKASNSLHKTLMSAFRLANMAEQVPNPNSRVSLAAECDQLGQRRVQLHWQLSSTDILSVLRVHRLIKSCGVPPGRLYIQLKR
jgi:hypothetical protein